MERSGTARQPQLLGQKKDKFWLTVGLCALTAALFFLPFYIIDGGFFHYAGDFNSQQISFYRYMNGFIRAQATRTVRSPRCTIPSHGLPTLAAA